MSVVEKIKIIEAIVKTPLYGVVGHFHNKLICITNVEGIRSLWYYDLETKETVKLCEDIYAVAKVRPFSPLIVFTRDVSKGRELQRVYIWNLEDRSEFEFKEFEPRRIFGIGFDGKLIAISAASKKIIELWTLKPYSTIEKVYETNSIIFVTDIGNDRIIGQGILRGDPRTYELFIFDLKTNEFRIYTPKEGSSNKNPKIFNDKILFSTTAYGNEKLMIYDLHSEELIEPEFSHSDYRKYKFIEYIAFDWTLDGKIWFIGKYEGRTKVFIDGKELPLPEGFSSSLTIVKDKAYVTYSSLSTPHSIYEVDMKSKKYKVLLGSRLSNKVLSSMGKPNLIYYKTFDNLKIPAYIIESNITQKPGPTVIYVHGGPWSEVADSWNIFIATLVASGYHVIAPNFRGSTGYGENFRRLDIGDPGGGDLLDVVYVAKWAKESKIASKLAIMGYSYGGYMTFLATVKYPEIWNAGVAGAGIVDWEEMYELSDAIFKQFINVLFANKKELLKERSPIHYIENLKAPICIIHPQNDTRTPLKPILRYIMKILELGKSFEVHIIPDMGHVVKSMDDALKILLPAIMFLDRHMKD